MAMGLVVLAEFFRDRQVPLFTDYARRFTDLPFMTTPEPEGDAGRAGRFLTAADFGDESERAAFPATPAKTIARYP
jgi:nitrate reductase alpha subunit